MNLGYTWTPAHVAHLSDCLQTQAAAPLPLQATQHGSAVMRSKQPLWKGLQHWSSLLRTFLTSGLAHRVTHININGETLHQSQPQLLEPCIGIPVGDTLRPTGLTLIRAGCTSISLGVTAIPAKVLVYPRGLTTMSWVETEIPVAPWLKKHGLRWSQACQRHSEACNPKEL